jgi:hypothetical protein
LAYPHNTGGHVDRACFVPRNTVYRLSLMDIDMESKLIKPIPNSPLHELSDEMLQDLVSLYRGRLKLGRFDIEECSQRINEIYKVFGYRCALEYIERYDN